ncbi:MAG: hypothetical protein JXR48_04680 [Candidatus Delongbacteria bacterium]|nr:hypothetical protein [Candidatus Delongbacteria bacterium]MBN2834243.1 hypothetical protein [Candidatus Delongbacteria bacterium]
MKKMILLLVLVISLFATTPEEIYKSGEMKLDNCVIHLSGKDLENYNKIYHVEGSEYLITGRKADKVLVFDIQTDEILHSFEVKGDAFGLTYDKLLATSDVAGNIRMYGFDGKVKRKTVIDYGVFNMIPLDKDNVILEGFTTTQSSIKYVAMLRNLETQKEQELESLYDKSFGGTWSYLVQEKKFVFNTAYSSCNLYIRKIDENNILVANNMSKNANVYDNKGKKIKTLEFRLDPIKIDDKIKDDYYKNILEVVYRNDDITRNWYENNELSEEDLLSKMKNELKFPEYMPYMYNLLVDMNGNILIFTYTMDDSREFYAFAFNKNNEFLGKVKIFPDDYEMNFSRVGMRFVFTENSLLFLATENDKTKLFEYKF